MPADATAAGQAKTGKRPGSRRGEAGRGGGQPSAGESGDAADGCREARWDVGKVAAPVCEAAGRAHARSARRRSWEESERRHGDLVGERQEDDDELSRRRARRPRYFKCKTEKNAHTCTSTGSPPRVRVRRRRRRRLALPRGAEAVMARRPYLRQRSSRTRPNPRTTSLTSYFLPNARHSPPSSPTSVMENPPLRLSASPGPLAGAAGRTQYLPSMPLQLAGAKSIALSISSGHLHGCTPTVRSIDPTDRREWRERGDVVFSTILNY
ncbi:uncharacterized protein [Triticum aestivum]|uniref:uncharacterized protein n=1 Tax=Triticum aestivum TaxID=4565 RepID=UPI001D0137AB|nr:uncharacterized protein LOC123080725 [Triticum aestivum]